VVFAVAGHAGAAVPAVREADRTTPVESLPAFLPTAPAAATMAATVRLNAE